METYFLLFCEKSIEGRTVRFMDSLLASPKSLYDRLELYKSLGTDVFKIVPIFVDENKGFVDLKF